MIVFSNELQFVVNVFKCLNVCHINLLQSAYQHVRRIEWSCIFKYDLGLYL